MQLHLDVINAAFGNIESFPDLVSNKKEATDAQKLFRANSKHRNVSPMRALPPGTAAVSGSCHVLMAADFILFYYRFLSLVIPRKIKKKKKRPPLRSLLESLKAVGDDHRQVPLSLRTLLLSLPSEFRLALLSGFVVTDGCVSSTGRNSTADVTPKPFAYTIGQRLLMSTRGKYRYQSHLSIAELAQAIGIAEGLRGQMNWHDTPGYGEIRVKFSGLLVSRLADAVQKILPRKYFEQKNARLPGIGNFLRIEEAPFKQRFEAETSPVFVFYSAADAPMTIVTANSMCCRLGACDVAVTKAPLHLLG